MRCPNDMLHLLDIQFKSIMSTIAMNLPMKSVVDRTYVSSIDRLFPSIELLRPILVHYLLKDFKLGYLLLFGPCTPYRYRLEGPNAWKDARQTILTQNER